MNNSIHAVVYGSTGLVGQTLVKLLHRHPNVKVDMLGHDEYIKADVYFLCTDAVTSKWYVTSILPKDARIIDFSDAFRMDSLDGIDGWSYGQIDYPEAEREYPGMRYPPRLLTNKISVAGCIASSIELALMPMIYGIKTAHITSIIGQSARGKKRAGNENGLRLSNVYTHSHNAELQKFFNDYESSLEFVPVVGPHDTGIMSIVQFNSTMSDTMLFETYSKFYANNKRVKVTNTNHDISQVIGMSSSIISTKRSPYTTSCCVTCSIDNLYRGSASHGIMLMEKMFGIESYF